MHSMRRLPLRIFNCQQFPLLLNFNFRRQFGHFPCLLKLQENGKATNLQPHLLQKQLASTFTEVENLPYKEGKYTRFLEMAFKDVKTNNKKYIGLCVQMEFDKILFPDIPLPEDAHSLIKAMDTMMNEFPDEEKPPIFNKVVKSCIPECEYKMEIRQNKYNQLEFSLEIIKNMGNASSHQGRIFFPVSLIPEFRDRMAKILAKFNGTKQYGPCPLPLPKWITANQVQDEEPQPRIYRRESLKYSMDPDKPADRRIKIEFWRGVTGKKFIQISQSYDKPRLNAKSAEEKYIYIHFPKILVPEDGYNLLSGMIDLSNDFKKKDDLPIQKNKHQSWSLICRQIVKGVNYDYKLEIHSRKEKHQFSMQTITTEATPWHKPAKLHVPIHVFDWLKAQMAYSLAADLDTEEYEDKENIPAEDK